MLILSLNLYQNLDLCKNKATIKVGLTIQSLVQQINHPEMYRLGLQQVYPHLKAQKARNLGFVQRFSE